MAGCNTGRNTQKYKGGGASTLQDALENGNTASLNINLSSPAVFIGDGGGLSNINASSTTGNLQAVTDNGATTTNKITFSNGVTSLQTSGNVVITGNVTATDFRGDGGTLSNISANKNFQEVTDLGATSSNKITLTNGVTSLQTSGNVSVTGNVTASKFYGDGTTLTGVALSTDLASNSTRIATVSTDLASNASRIGVVETDLASNSTRIGTVSTDLASNASRIGVVETDLSSNASRIGVVETDLASNSTRIGTVITDLASNASRIGVVETDLASNATRVTNLETDMTSNASRIGDAEMSILSLETNLTGNSTRIGTVSTDLASNSTRIGTISTDLASNASRIGVLETDLASNSTRIGTVSTDLASNSTRIGTVSTDLTDNASRISTLESETQPVTRGGTNLTGFAKGDIIIASDTNELSNLNLGTGGHVLTANTSTSLPEWRSAGEIGATVKTLSNGSYIIGGAFTGADELTWSIKASTSNLSNYIVVRDSSGDINVSNVNAVEYYGDGGTLSNIVGSQDLDAVITEDPFTSSAAYFGAGLYGEIKGSNTINAHTLSSLELYGEVKGSNAISSSTVNAITLNANVNAGNVVSTDIYGTIKGSNNINGDTITATTGFSGSGASLTNLPAGELTGDIASARLPTVPVTKGGTGLSTVVAGDILYASADDTIAARAKGDDGQFLTLSSGLPAWASVSSTTMTVTNDTDSTNDQGIIYAEDVGSSKSLESDADTLKYKRSTGTLTTSNVITSDTSVDARNGIANTTPTHTLDVGSNVSVIDDGVDKLVIRGNCYVINDIISLGTMHTDILKAKDAFIKNTTVVAERPTRQVRLN